MVEVAISVCCNIVDVCRDVCCLCCMIICDAEGIGVMIVVVGTYLFSDWKD